MGAEKERDAVRGLYPTSTKWAKRVNQMSDAQVVAIYIKEINKSKIQKKEGDSERPDQPDSSGLDF